MVSKGLKKVDRASSMRREEVRREEVQLFYQVPVNFSTSQRRSDLSVRGCQNSLVLTLQGGPKSEITLLDYLAEISQA